MVQGDIPFEQDEEICNAKLKFDRKDISAECRDLITACLRIRPVDRIQLDDILGHAWLQTEDEMVCDAASTAPPSSAPFKIDLSRAECEQEDETSHGVTPNNW